MIDLTRTTTALLQGLFDVQNHEVWLHFDSRYRPILLAFSKKLGLDDADAADVAQDTLTLFVEQYRNGRYDRGRSRLRSWLIGIAKYRILDIHRARDRRREHGGVSALAELPDDDDLTRIWDQQRRATLLRRALDELRSTSKTQDRTIQAFELLIIQQKTTEEVCRLLGMSAQELYLAKSRVAARVRTILQQIEALYDADD